MKLSVVVFCSLSPCHLVLHLRSTGCRPPSLFSLSYRCIGVHRRWLNCCSTSALLDRRPCFIGMGLSITVECVLRMFFWWSVHPKFSAATYISPLSSRLTLITGVILLLSSRIYAPELIGLNHQMSFHRCSSLVH